MEKEAATYRMVASGPAVPADEVEATEQAIEVIVMWGEEVLNVAHLSPPRPFVIGEADETGAPDFLVGADTLGTARLPIVVDAASGPAVLIPEGATLAVQVGDETRELAALEAGGLVSGSHTLAGAREHTLARGATARIEHRGFTFIVRPVAAGRKVGKGLASMIAAADHEHLKYVGGALALAAVLLTLLYFVPPASAGISLSGITDASRLVDYMDSAPATDDEEEVTWHEPGQDAGGDGQRAAEEEGQMGDRESPVRERRSAIRGDADPRDQQMANRQAQREAARTAGIIGTLSALTGSWNEPTSPFGRDEAIGADDTSALGNLMGPEIGNAFGFGGLGLYGTGRGAGGDGRGTYGLGAFGTIGHGAGCRGENCTGGYGDGVGLRTREPRETAPNWRPGPVDVAGSLSKEVIRRVVQRHRNEVRFCYERALAQQPDLEGRVTVMWLISGDGSVSSAVPVNGRSDLASAEATSCVASAVRTWSFPQPENGGMVSVTYPFIFATN